MGNINERASGKSGVKVLTGRVVDGRIELGGGIEDGTTVVVFAPAQEGLSLTETQKDELSSAFDEIKRGDFEDGLALLREIKAEADT